jgi:hypothetical protein
MKTTYILLAFVLMLILPVAAQPTMTSVTGVSNIQATFNGNFGGSFGWFQYGTNPTTNFIYSTPNSSVSGAYSYTQYAGPLLAGTTYYAEACDNTGCSNIVSFTTSPIAPVPQTNYGTALTTIFTSGLNITQSAGAVFAPYTMDFPYGIAWGLLIFTAIILIWTKQKDIYIPLLLMLVFGGMIWGGSSLFPIPPDWLGLGQGLMYASIAGLIFVWWAR